MFDVDKRGQQRRLLGVGNNGIYSDAWGRQKVINDYSLFHVVFTYSVTDKKWIEYNDGVEVAKTGATSVNGELVVASNANDVLLLSRRNPRYQPNRGILYSTSTFLDNATASNGTLYAVTRTYRDSTVYESREEINLPQNFNPAKGHVYDIQAQWRGVGNYKFFIDLAEVHSFNYLGTLDNLSVSNPALPIAFECDNTGTIRWGLFTPQFGMFFEWVFDTPQDTQARWGCVDLTTEGGKDEIQEYVSITGNAITVSNDPILAIRIPETISGVMNTIGVQLHRIKSPASKKGSIEVWQTRDSTALTISTGSWTSVNGGNIEYYAPSSASDSSLTTTNCSLVDVFPVEAGINNIDDNPSPDLIRFMLTHGDYLILRGVGSTVELQAIIQMGEEL